MSTLKNYNEFEGRHSETGTLRNVLAYQGNVMPHTGKPISEAFLLGVSGGIAFGYFTFEYKGFDAQVNLLSRNTFDPFETMLERLGITREVLQTTNADKGAENLTAALENGKAAIVWADAFSLPYNAYPSDAKWWAMQPLVVFGYDDEIARLADRSARALTIEAQALQHARARVKQEKFRVMTLGQVDLTRVKGAVKKGIEQCVRLFTQKPPKGTRDNFGFSGMRHWAEMLTNTRNKQSWERWLPPGRRAYAALAGTGVVPGVYDWIMNYGASDAMERELYAEFLDEAAALLYKSKLESAAHYLRLSAALWRELAQQILPDDAPTLKETRALLTRRHDLFITQEQAALAEIQTVNARLKTLRDESAENFPWDDKEYAARRAQWSDSLMQVHAIEERAVTAMREALE